ncbi:Predicted signal transduction protein containing a membrane domain [Candidatus Terasakiella magnetica]|nr:Predicted signal transduction protein containing a membrane domain [Candidatus Terasakiella magnetica]
MSDDLRRRIAELSRQVEDLELYRSVVNHACEAIFVTDPDNRIIAINPAFTAITGFTTEDAIGQNPRMLKSGFQDAVFYAEMWNTLSTTGHWQGELVDRRKDGQPYREWLSIATQHDEAGKVVRRIAVFRDVTEASDTAEKLWQRSNFDPLTELPNRNLFLDRLLQALVLAGREDSKAALMFIGLDGFKNINDSLGHWIGDKVLQEAARRFQMCLRQGDTVARFGGDEFTVVLAGIHTTEEVEGVVRSVLEVLQEPFVIEQHQVLISCSIGVCLWPGDGDDVEALMRNSTAAMQQAKQAGRNTFRFFTPAMDARAQARSRLADELASALAQGEFHMVFQPLVDGRTGQVVAAEALLRWHNRYIGVVSPEQFVPLAEEIGLIRPIGEWLLLAACREALVWQGMGLGDIKIAVNISPRQFQQGDIVAIIERALAETGLPPRLLTIEITEGLLLGNGEEVLEKIERIRATGVTLSVDDFGTGYSSLSYLKQFPVDILKIDRSFISNVLGNGEDATLVEAIIALGHSMHMEVVAEGVETIEQMAFLAERGCDLLQGYYFSPPLVGVRFREFVLARAETASLGLPELATEPPSHLSYSAPLLDGALSRIPSDARVLFADDVELVRMVFNDFLEGTGCQIDMAETGGQALARIKAASQPYDLVVLDLYMPGMDGFTTARAIREYMVGQGMKRVPIVALTSANTEDERWQAKDAGFDRFLAKPISRAELLAAMADMLPPEQTGVAPPPTAVDGIEIPPGLEHLMPTFLAEMVKDQDKLRALSNCHERAALTEHVHAMRGKCGMFGETVLFDLLTRLEALTPMAEHGEIVPLVVKVIERIGKL